MYQEIKHHEMRLLRTFHGRPADRLKCMLYVTNMPAYSKQHVGTDIVPYTCLSYWTGNSHESPGDLIAIYYDTGSQGKHQILSALNRYDDFYISDNLKAGLLKIRHSHKDVDVWVDALCVDMKNLSERSDLVSKMAVILHGAKMILAWLGHDHRETSSFFRFLCSILNLRHLEHIIETKAAPENWISVLNWMSNRYFTRRWVLQELVFSRKVVVQCGDQALLWSDFEDAISLILQNFSAIEKIFNPSHFDRHFSEYQYDHAAACVRAKRQILRRSCLIRLCRRTLLWKS